MIRAHMIKKIKPIPIEFRRPSILRASGHTFEYVGYGPGNYSTALPQLQNRSLTEREELCFLYKLYVGSYLILECESTEVDKFDIRHL